MRYNFLFTNKNLSKRPGYLLFSGVFCILLDQGLKYLARKSETLIYIIDQVLGWEYFENTGIAFGIPVPTNIVIPLTFTILIAGLWYFYHIKKDDTKIAAGVLIAAGAVSNLIDRVVFGFTIDYIRILTTIINLADILVLTGMFLLLKKELKPKKEIEIQ